jgi:hypothetical protein
MKVIIAALLFISLSSCNWFKQKTKDTVNKTGEVVAKTGSEFVNGVSKGVEKTFENEIVFSDELKKRGLSTGKISIRNSDSASNNILTAYLIFEQPFTGNVTVRVLNSDGLEYGRSSLTVSGDRSDGKYFDFVFDKRTNIESRGKLIFQ